MTYLLDKWFEKKFHQDLTSGIISRLYLFSKSLPDGPADGVRWEGTSIRRICKSFIKIWHQEPYQDSTCPPSLWRTWTFLMELEMVLGNIHHVSVKVSSWPDIRNHIKTPPVLQVSSWSLGGHGHSWWTWKWCQMGGNTHPKCLRKFHQDPTCIGWFKDDWELQVVVSVRT